MTKKLTRFEVMVDVLKLLLGVTCGLSLMFFAACLLELLFRGLE